MKASIVMATYNRANLLQSVLESIRAQRVPFPYEVIVADDGSRDSTKEVCDFYGARYIYLDRPGYRNPGPARNAGYRMAIGEVIIAQSSDTRHDGEDVIERLAEIEPGAFNIATVRALREDGSYWMDYTSISNQRPLFFLGSLRRADLYAIGGDDEDFTMLGCEDDWFADRLIRGRKLRPVYRPDILGTHLWHERPPEHWDDQFDAAKKLLAEKRRQAEASGQWVAAGGAWNPLSESP